MSTDTVRAILKHIFADLEPGDGLTLAFQGGEPTLAGLGYFRRFTDEVARYDDHRVQVSYALQTNGLLLDEEWCAFLKEHQVLVGLSLDGPAVCHDANRVDADRKGTFRQVMAAKERMDRFRVEYNILMVLTSQLARHPQQVWRFIREQNIRFVQFIPCLGPLEGGDFPQTLTPGRYAQFYISLFDQWFRAYEQGKYISVKLFDDLVNLLAWGQCNACGLTGKCQAQVIVEADGSVYPCDFYVLDQYRTGSLKEESLLAVHSSPVVDQFQNRACEAPPLCIDCPYRQICGGGCKRMRQEVFCDPKSGVCGHQIFLNSCISRLRGLASEVRRQAAGQGRIR